MNRSNLLAQCLTLKLILWFGLNSYLNSQSLPHITLSTQRRVLAGGVFPDLTLWLLSHQLTGPICRVTSSVRSSSVSLSPPPSSPPWSPPPTSSSSSLQRSQATSPTTSSTFPNSPIYRVPSFITPPIDLGWGEGQKLSRVNLNWRQGRPGQGNLPQFLKLPFTECTCNPAACLPAFNRQMERTWKKVVTIAVAFQRIRSICGIFSRYS